MSVKVYAFKETIKYYNPLQDSEVSKSFWIAQGVDIDIVCQADSLIELVGYYPIVYQRDFDDNFKEKPLIKYNSFWNHSNHMFLSEDSGFKFSWKLNVKNISLLDYFHYYFIRLNNYLKKFFKNKS